MRVLVRRQPVAVGLRGERVPASCQWQAFRISNWLDSLTDGFYGGGTTGTIPLEDFGRIDLALGEIALTCGIDTAPIKALVDDSHAALFKGDADKGKALAGQARTAMQKAYEGMAS